MKKLMIIAVAISALFAVACTQNIPTRTSINDYVLMNIRSSSARGVDFAYNTDITNNRLPLYGQNKSPYSSGGVKFTTDQTNALKSMLNQYLTNKFHEINPSAALKLKIRLTDFYVERYGIDSGVIRALAVMTNEYSGLTYRNNAVVSVIVELDNGGEIITRSFSASAEVDSTDGKEVAAIGEAINLANNRILMLLNAFLAEHEL